MVCGPLLGVVGAAGADAATTTTTVAPKPSTTTTTAKPPVTTRRGPGEHDNDGTGDNDHLRRPGARRPVDHHDHGTPQHVVNQPNINALTPHVVALQGKGVQYQSSSGVKSQGIGPSVPSYLSSPGGPYLYDSKGRVILMHGVNVVYKHAPYIAYPDPGEPWNFDATDAAKMQRLGFNVVRLGIEWQALEPGSGGPNQPQICTAGTPETTSAVDEWNQTVAEQYLNHVAATVKLLAQYGIYTLLDMHQDVYNQNFRGEGAPELGRLHEQRADRPQGRSLVEQLLEPDPADGGGALLEPTTWWATCRATTTWSGRRWPSTSRTIRGSSGTTPSTSLSRPRPRPPRSRPTPDSWSASTSARATRPTWPTGPVPLTCPPGDPDNGVIPTIQSVDSHHLTFVEPDIYWVTGGNIPSQLGPLPFKRIVFNFHTYCGDRSPVTGNPTDLLKCLQAEETAASEQDITRLSMGSAAQPTGPAIFMSEFGATTSIPLAGFDVEWAGLDDLGWIYWAWKYYDDPTGSSAEGLVQPDGSYSPIVTVLSRTYPQAVAGDPNSTDLQSLHGGVQHGVRTDTGSERRDDRVHRGVAALPERMVRGGEERTDHVEARCQSSHRANGRASGAGVHLGDGGSVPLSS